MTGYGRCRLERKLLIFLAVCLAAPARAQVRPPGEIEGVPVPRPGPEYRLPVSKPATVFQGSDSVSRREDPLNRYAWDFELPVGTAVVAARAGVVTRVRNLSNIGGPDRTRFLNEANLVVIDHLDATGTRYGHLSKIPDPVRIGEYVLRGEQIGSSGDTGFAQYPHLIYTVLDTDTDQSLPSRFGDFKPNGGVPEKGDKVPAAEPPEVPQKVIDLYKKLWWASERANALGCTDLAWQFTTEVPRNMRHPEYFYDRVMAAREERLRKWLKERLEALAALLEPKAKEMLEAVRYTESLARIYEWDLKMPLIELRKRMADWSGEAFEACKKEKTAVRSWIEGLRGECLGDMEGALGGYGRAVQYSRGPFMPLARESFDRYVRINLSGFQENFSRLEYEASASLPKHRLRIDQDAKAAWNGCQKVLKTWFKHRPDQEKEAKAALAEAEARYEKIMDE